MKKYNVAVIGGGASGILTALLLKEKGIETAVFESQDRILKKVLVTGNGRCNLTNESLKDTKNIEKYFSTSSGREGLLPLYKNGFQRIEEVLNNLGIPMVTLDEGKMYPYSLQASAVVDLMRERLSELNIPVFTDTRITSLYFSQGIWNLGSSSGVFQAEKVVISVGGLAMPSTGSDGSFHKVLKNLGLGYSDTEPALVQLKVSSPCLKALSGVKNETRITLFKDGTDIASEKGELLFTDYGISGPPVLQLSRFCAGERYKNLNVSLDLFPDISRDELKEFIRVQRNKFPMRSVSLLIPGMLNKKLIPVIFKASGVEKMTQKSEELKDENIDSVLSFFKEWKMEVTGNNGYKNAQSTSGGVRLDEVDPESMESLRHRGLYLTGEVLDVCGACGGYNLSWAFSSAITCADAISRSIKK